MSSRMFELLLGLLLCNVSLCEEYCRNLEHCNCDENSLECHGEHTLSHTGTLLGYIRNNVTRVVVEGSNIPELGRHALGECWHNPNDPGLPLKNLKLLSLSNNHIRKINVYAFTCMTYLEELVLSQNDWVVDSNHSKPGYFTPLEYLKRLNLTNAFSHDPRNQTIKANLESLFDSVHVKKLEMLILSHNELTTLPRLWIKVICSMTSLKTLDLSYNNLVTDGNIPGVSDYVPGGLVSLDISFNNLTRLPTFLLGNIDKLDSLNSLHIENNSFECDCLFLKTYDWLLESGVDFDDNAVVCFAGNQSLHGKQVMSMLRDELCASNRDSQSSARGHSGSFVTVIMVTVLIVH